MGVLDDTSAGDLARELTDEGVQKCVAAHEQWFQELFDGSKLCLVSPTLRTRDTCRHTLGNAIILPRVEVVEGFYNTAASGRVRCGAHRKSPLTLTGTAHFLRRGWHLDESYGRQNRLRNISQLPRKHT